MKLYCPLGDGGHTVNVRFNPSPGERCCPEHGCRLFTADPSKPRKGLSRNGGARGLESPTETAARQDFNRRVCQWPCFFQRHREGHVCRYPLDAHHLIPKQFIRQRLSGLPEDELLQVLYNPLIGAPLCRAAHNAVESGADRIYWEELSAECVQFVSGLPEFMALRLEEECPRREVAV